MLCFRGGSKKEKSDLENVERFDTTYKVVVVGDVVLEDVGKSSLIIRFLEHSYMENCLFPRTSEFGYKIVHRGNKYIKVSVFDTLGQERFGVMTNEFYKNSNIIIIVYDITKRSTYENALSRWLSKCTSVKSKQDVILLIGNKLDCEEEERQVTTSEAREFANTNELIFFETSSKSNINCDRIFKKGIQQYYNNTNKVKIYS